MNIFQIILLFILWAVGYFFMPRLTLGITIHFMFDTWISIPLIILGLVVDIIDWIY